MPPKKEVKEKPLKPDQAEECIEQYMKSVNRPYSSTDVSMNLKGKVPKPLTQKVMLALAEKGVLTVKAYGKQTIFVYNQSTLDVASGDDLVGLDEQLREIKAELDDKRKEYKALSTELAAKLELPQTKDLQSEISTVKAANETTVKALLPYRGDDDGNDKVEPMSEEDIKKIDKDFDKWRKQWIDRRKVYKELMGMMSEGGQVLDTASFEDDQGINSDDEEAKEIEQGEFCQARPMLRKPPAKKAVAAPPTATVAAKRTAEIASTPEAEENSQQKKRAKKVKA